MQAEKYHFLLPGGAMKELTDEQVDAMNAYWRAANYLSVGQIYLYANPLLR
jgi:xylulose-5-phosphate/fructose-6-phosphate phosphoketolase